jgi:outer membrane protein insertion porin family
MSLALLGLAAMLLLLVGFGFFPQEPVRRLAERALRQAVGEGSRLGHVHVVPLLLRADVSELRLEGRSFSLSVPRARVVGSAGTLFAGMVALRSVELDSPHLELREVSESGEASRAPRTGVVFPPVSIGDVKVRDAYLAWADPATGKLELRDVSARGALGRGALEIASPSGAWHGRAGTSLEFGPTTARLAVTSTLDVAVESLEARLGSSRLSARGPLLERAALAPRLDVDAMLDLADLGPRLRAGGGGGRVSVSGRLEGATDGWRANLQVRGDAGYGAWWARRLQGTAEWTSAGPAAQARVTAQVAGGDLRGEARLDGDEVHAWLRARGVALADLPGVVKMGVAGGRTDVDLSWDGPPGGPFRVESRAEGDVRQGPATIRFEVGARGTLDPHAPSVDGTWTARLQTQAGSLEAALEASGDARGAFPPPVTGTLSGTATLTREERKVEATLGGSLDVRGALVQAALNVRGSAGSVRLEGEVRGERLVKATLRSGPIDLGLLVPGLEGSGSLEAEGSGPLRSPSISLRAHASGLAWQGAALGALEARADGDARRLDLQVSLPDLSIESEGELSLEAAHARGRTRLEDTPLSPFSRFLPEGAAVQGHVTATVTHDVSLGRLEEAVVTAEVAALDVEGGGRAVRAGPFEATLQGGQLTVRGLDLGGEGLHLTGSGKAGFGPEGPVDVDASLSADLAALPLPEGWRAAGTGQAHVRIRGSRDEPTVEGSIGGRDVVLTGPSVPETRIDRIEAELAGDRLRILPAVVRVGGGPVTLEGEVPWAAVWPALRKGPLSPAEEVHLVARAEGVTVAPLEGSLSGELDVEGGLASLQELRATLTLPATHLRLEGIAVDLAPTTLRLDRGRLTVPGLAVSTGGGPLLASGTVDLAERVLDLRAKGRLDLGLVSPLIAAASIGGRADVDLAVAGPLDAPKTSGTLQIHDGSLRLRSLPQAVTGLDGRIDLAGATARLDATGQLGGGPLQLTGEGQIQEGRTEFWLQLTGRDVALRYPPGLRSRIDVDLTLAGQPGDLTLAGGVKVKSGVYALDTALREALRPSAPSSGPSSTLRDVALDVSVDLVRPVQVTSSFGSLEATGRITARGDLAEPAPFGRLDVLPGGQIEIQGRELTVTDGALTYGGGWNADLVLHAETAILAVENDVNYQVKVALEGSLDQPSLELDSEPSLGRQQIASLIATGRTDVPFTDTGAWLLGGQAATLLSGGLTRHVAASFGLDEITVRPDLVANETDPSARFTFGKQLGPYFRVIYSAGLGGPETRFVEFEARPGRDLTLRAQRTDAGAYEYGGGQRFEWGAATVGTAASDQRTRLADVRIETKDEALEKELRDQLPLSPGARVLDWEVPEAAERMQRRLRRRGYLEAEVAGRLEEKVAVFSVNRGPLYEWRVEGIPNPPDLDPAVRRALFEADALDLGRERLLDALHAQGYLRAEVEATAQSEGGERRVLLFTVKPGPRFTSVAVTFPGAASLPRSVLLDAAGGGAGLLERPQAAVSALEEIYRAHFFLAARVAVPRVEVKADTVSIVVGVEEGAPARLAGLRFEGATLPEAELRRAAGVQTGALFSEDVVSQAVGGVRSLYFSRGYSEARIRPELVPEGSDLVLLLRLREGERHTIEKIVVDGNDRTRDWLVRRALQLEPGDALDPRSLSAAERRLMNLGVFSRAAIVPEPAAPSTLRVNLSEAPNLGASYDLRWNDDTGASALVQGEGHNLFGLGPALGARFRYGADLRETRGWLSLPSALAGGNVTASAFRTEQDFSPTLTRVDTGFQVQQTLRLPARWQLLAGYTFHRSTTLDTTPGSDLPPIPIDVAGLDLSVLRNTRDDVLDPRSGRFYSLNVKIAPSFLGSDAPLVKSYGQALFARSFADNAFTWAQSYRLGLAWGLGGEPVIFSERFMAGGANSLRGFGTNDVGPLDFDGTPLGGEAVLILNQELRYRHPSGLGAAVFYDGGNVFETVRDVSLDLRHTLGAGLRWSSPIGLLRLDVGFPLARQPGEKAYRVFFSFGQAF